MNFNMFEKQYDFLCRNILLPLSDSLSNQKVMEYYDFIDKAQWWSREQLIKYQNQKLIETVNTAYNETPFYRELFESNRISPSEIRNVNDLQRIPIVTKDMLRKAYPLKCCRRSKYPWQEAFTSGSTGSPFVVRIDSYSMSIARALMLLRATFSGWTIGERLLQTGMSLKRGVIKYIKDNLLRVSYVSAFDLSDKALDQYLEIVESKKIRYLMGYASSLFCIAKRAEEVGFNYSLKGAVSWGDNLFHNYRKKIENQFKIKVTDTYGCGEGIQVSAQCGENDGEYHIFMPHVIVEFLENGLPVLEGELGEIVLTRLDPGAMPLIRYCIGDIGRGSDKDSCSCGRGLKMMSKIEGRNSDIIITPNGNKLIVHFFTGIFEYYKSIKYFQVCQKRLDEIIIKIVPEPDFSEKDCMMIKNEINEKGDMDLKINIEIVDEIPLEKSNKRRFVISDVT